MSRAGRLALVNSVLTATLTYFLTVFDPPKWFIKKIDRIRRNFLWCGEDTASGAKCLVNWKQVCSPKCYGGLDVKDLQMFSKSLCLRWLWLDWLEADRPWHGLPLPTNAADMLLFQSCTSIVIGNGSKARFWKDAWLNGTTLQQRYPDLYLLARRKNLTVQAAILNGRWMNGLQRINSPVLIDHFASLWDSIQEVQLTDSDDSISWEQASNSSYSASSAYLACFVDQPLKPLLASVWEVRAEGNVKFFLWLLIQNRLWTADMLETRGWPHQDTCALCDQVIESASHLILHCSYAKQVWQSFAQSHVIAVNAANRSTTI